jgi:hypothetical protein
MRLPSQEKESRKSLRGYRDVYGHIDDITEREMRSRTKDEL